MTRRRYGALVCLLAGVVCAPACGKKGPPLAPFSHVPGPTPDTSVRRRGDEVYVRFTVPSVNSDNRKPANVDRVDVYALTAEPTSATLPQPGTANTQASQGISPALIIKRGTLVGSVVVREPPPPPPEVKEGEPPPPPPSPRTDPGLDQGVPALVVDALTEEALRPITPPEMQKAMRREAKYKKRQAPKAEPRLAPPDLGPPLPTKPVRYYVVVGANGGDKGLPSQRFSVPVEAPPPAPGAPSVSVLEGRLEVTWTAPEGLRRPILLTVAPPKPPEQPASRNARRPGTLDQQLAAPAEGVPLDQQQEQEEEESEEEPQAAAPGVPPSTAEAGLGSPPVPGAAAPSVREPIGSSSEPEAPASAAPASALSQVAQAPEAAGAPGVLPARLLSFYANPTYAYAVYEVAPKGYQPPRIEPGSVPPFPALLTPSPMPLTTWTDPRFEVGVERCYAVRTVATTGLVTVESAMSPPACVKAVDTFAPAAPKQLAAVASEGAISLIWEGNSEADLAGYIVLRGTPGGPMKPLMTAPIKETTFRDTTVRRGVRYAYAVVAVDTATPSNTSAQSNVVEETAR
jgi:hypothetical protein